MPVIILNWNGEADTIECLRSIRRSETAGFVPVVIDNGSDAAAVERLAVGARTVYDRVLECRAGELVSTPDALRARAAGLPENALVLVRSPENLGFARGCNLGSRFGELVGWSPWVMLLNNDTVVRPETFATLRRFVEAHPAFPAVTAQIQYFEPSTRIQNCGGDLTFFGSRRYRLANADASVVRGTEYSVVTFVTGCALLYNVRAVGPLTEDFFFGEEDYEFSLRLRRLGLPMACVHAAVVHHKVGASIARSARPLGAILANYVTRLVNVRNYYSRIRWHATRLLAYLYLPVLLMKSGIDPRRSISTIRKVESYIRQHRAVGRTEFQSLVASE